MEGVPVDDVRDAEEAAIWQRGAPLFRPALAPASRFLTTTTAQCHGRDHLHVTTSLYSYHHHQPTAPTTALRTPSPHARIVPLRRRRRVSTYLQSLRILQLFVFNHCDVRSSASHRSLFILNYIIFIRVCFVYSVLLFTVHGGHIRNLHVYFI